MSSNLLNLHLQYVWRFVVTKKFKSHIWNSLSVSVWFRNFNSFYMVFYMVLVIVGNWLRSTCDRNLFVASSFSESDFNKKSFNKNMLKLPLKFTWGFTWFFSEDLLILANFSEQWFLRFNLDEFLPTAPFDLPESLRKLRFSDILMGD